MYINRRDELKTHRTVKWPLATDTQTRASDYIILAHVKIHNCVIVMNLQSVLDRIRLDGRVKTSRC